MPDRAAAWTVNEEPHQLMRTKKIAIVKIAIVIVMTTKEDEGGGKRDDSHVVKDCRERVSAAHAWR